jgi:Tfp pilus assembly protein PilV
MAAQAIGSVKSGSGKTYQVKWDSVSKDVYVSYAGWSSCGKAQSAGDAMNKAEAYVYNK